MSPAERERAPWRDVVHEVIFEADTPTGKAFDIALFIAIVASVAVVMLDSVDSIREGYGGALRAAEWAFTVAFTIEYIFRVLSVDRPTSYARSFFGVVDLLAVVPTYLSVLIPGAQSLLVIRTLRLLRIFRVLKLAQFLSEASHLGEAMRKSARKIIIFLGVVLTVVVIAGATMYIVEGDESGFTSIPRSIYWAIVTMTTVGYGDIAPQTVLGQSLAAMLMVAGYGIIAVPTGIVTVEMSQALKSPTTQACKACAAEGHDADARHCKYCGAAL